MNLNRSLNEIEAMALRAARGSGMSWGLAQEAGKSTRWLTHCGLPASELLVQLLEQNDHVTGSHVAPEVVNGTWSNRKGLLCPIITGATLCDMALVLESGHTIEMQNVSFPIFIVSFTNRAAALIKHAISTEWNGINVITDGHSMSVSGDSSELMASRTDTLRCFVINRSVARQHSVKRGDVNEQSWEKLSALAHRTYAPATEESRLLGAGSGLSDND